MPEVDKDQLYGNFQKSADWKDSLYKSVCHKALDVAEDMGVQANRIVNGMGWKELAVIGAIGLGGWWVAQQGGGENATPVQPAPPAAVSPADSSYDVLFFDADGKPIKVPPISELPKK